MAVEQDLTIYAGEDITLTVSPASGVSPTDITGWSLSFTLLTKLGGSTVFTKTTGGGGITITNASGGVFTVTISASNSTQTPGSYVYFIRRTDSGNVSVLTKGRLTIKPSS